MSLIMHTHEGCPLIKKAVAYAIGFLPLPLPQPLLSGVHMHIRPQAKISFSRKGDTFATTNPPYQLMAMTMTHSQSFQDPARL